MPTAAKSKCAATGYAVSQNIYGTGNCRTRKLLSVETAAGIIRPERCGQMVKVDMGEPVLEGRLIPVNH